MLPEIVALLVGIVFSNFLCLFVVNGKMKMRIWIPLSASFILALL